VVYSDNDFGLRPKHVVIYFKQNKLFTNTVFFGQNKKIIADPTYESTMVSRNVGNHLSSSMVRHAGRLESSCRVQVRKQNKSAATRRSLALQLRNVTSNKSRRADNG
jgi:hypothetical protein